MSEKAEKCCQEFKGTLIAENKALKESRDELLGCLESTHLLLQALPIPPPKHLFETYKKAEALKEKE